MRPESRPRPCGLLRPLRTLANPIVPALLLAFGFVGCGLPTRSLVPVDCAEMKMAALAESAERLSFEGFSVMPPHDGRWCVEHFDKKTEV
jgi:hypothetical protein